MASEVKNSWLVPAQDKDRQRCNILVGRTDGNRVVVGVTAKDGTAYMPIDDAIKLKTRLGQAIDAAALGRGDPDRPED